MATGHQRNEDATKTMSNNELPITGLIRGKIPSAVLVCGDPARATKTAGFLDKVELLSERREYRTYQGIYGGVSVAVCSHGVGAPGAAAAFEELIAAGARYLIRIGTCGSLRLNVRDGDLVIATAAVDTTGFGRQVVPEGYPAVPDWQVTAALIEAVKAAGPRYHTGIILTTDHFYPGIETHHTPHYPTLAKANVVAVEMECSALFLVGSLRGVQTGAILAVDGYVGEDGESMDVYDPQRDVVDEAVTVEIELALQTLQKITGNVRN